jgi:hypothetical protein
MKNFFVLVLMVLVQGCTGLSMLTISSRDLKGRDVDEVVEMVRSRGLSCGNEYQPKDLGGEPYGLVVCGAKGVSPMCPTSYSVRIVFSLKTRKVLSLTKDERENCF